MDTEQLIQLLVVDDSRTITASVKRVLDSAEYEIRIANSGEEALETIKKYGLPHLAIIDINLGRNRMNGFQLCSKLHQISDLPIILLTSEDAEETVVEGLRHHAEDYVIKPFRSQELQVRVWRVLQRMGDFGYTLSPTIEVDERLQVNLPERQVLLDGKPVTLTPTETKILYMLMKHAGRTVRTDFLLRRIWPLEEAYEDRLHPHVYRLRKKLEQNPREPQYILAEWGVGYSFPSQS